MPVRPRFPAGVALLAAAAGCASIGPGVAGPASEVARTERFAFHSHELVNLHHFLYRCAKARARRDGERALGVEVRELPAIDALSGREREAWEAAVTFYREEAIERDLLFDGELYAVKRALPGVEDAAGPWPAEVEGPGYAEALRAALPVYRARFWADHDRANRAWIAAVLPRLERLEPVLVERMTAAYGGAWPGLVRVDVCAYANWAGAYTTGGPAHVVLASGAPANRGDAALEVLMHEASHTPAMIAGLRDELAAACDAAGVEPPPDLWHVLLFVTAGEVTRRALAEDGIGGYETYADAAGIYARGPTAPFTPSVRRIWEGYLAGEVDRGAALERIAALLDPV